MDRLKSRREVLSETQSSARSSEPRSHPMPKKGLAPASQEILASQDITHNNSQPQTPPRQRR